MPRQCDLLLHGLQVDGFEFARQQQKQLEEVVVEGHDHVLILVDGGVLVGVTTIHHLKLKEVDLGLIQQLLPLEEFLAREFIITRDGGPQLGHFWSQLLTRHQLGPILLRDLNDTGLVGLKYEHLVEVEEGGIDAFVQQEHALNVEVLRQVRFDLLLTVEFLGDLDEEESTLALEFQVVSCSSGSY